MVNSGRNWPPNHPNECIEVRFDLEKIDADIIFIFSSCEVYSASFPQLEIIGMIPPS